MSMFRRTRNDMSRAAEWFARVRSGDLDPPADKAWAQWMDADLHHQQAYDDLELAWQMTEELRDRPSVGEYLRDIDAELQGPASGARGKRFAAAASWRTALPWRAGLAAAALVLVGAVAALILMNRTDISEYSTGIGEQRTVTLADASAISLNTATRIRVAYSGSLRRVELLSGEALFSVAKDSKRPFEVHALHGTATAVGTEFDVQVSGSATSVSVLAGTVKVQAVEKAENGEFTKVEAGQAVDYTEAGTTSAIRAADVGRVRGWQAQRIVFSDVALADALQDYNRYIKIPIVLADPTLKTRRINGVFRIGDQDAFLNALEQGLRVKATKMPSQIVLHSR